MEESGATKGDKVPFFSALSDDDLKQITAIAKEKTYLPGDVIVREKTMTDAFCIIKSGKVEITKNFMDGDAMVLSVMGEGDFFGEMALLDPGPRSATVRALVATTILELSRQDFERLLLNAPTLAYAIMRELGKRLRDTGSLLVSHLERKNMQLTQAYLDTVQALVNALEARDPYTRGHTSRVTIIAKAIAKRMGLVKEDLFSVEIGALLHDLGKIAVPDAVLRKPGPLEREEYEKIMEHPKQGEQILVNVEYLSRCIPSILYHHERYDGKGYPQGIAGKNIPLFGRILAVADSVDAMTSDRPYRKRMSVATAISELEKGAGKQFDSDVVKAFIEAFEGRDLDSLFGIPERESP